jgi:arsenate reductase (thioredoxin)
MEKQTVLFICSFNSVRSQIAEGLLRSRCGERYDVYSAGVAPAGLNPHAVFVMKELGIDITSQRSKSLNGFSTKKFDYVVTLCDQVPRAAASTMPRGNNGYHRGFVSPSEARKEKDAIIADYRTLRDDIGTWLCEIFPDCPAKGDPVAPAPGESDSGTTVPGNN